MKPESQVLSEVRKRASDLGIHLWRNNRGACEDAKSGRVIRYGIANDSKAMDKRIKSSDLIGWTNDGRFVSVECKAEGWKLTKNLNAREEAQLRWITLVRQHNGVAGFVTTVEEFDKLMGVTC